MRPVLVGTVSRVVDGDTIVVQLSSGSIRVRLYGIDAPEHNQPGGPEATAALKSLVGGARVELEPVSQDRYNRMVARVRRGRMDVNAQMVRQGHAWVYRSICDARTATGVLWKCMPGERTEDCGLVALFRPGTFAITWAVFPYRRVPNAFP